VNYAAIEHLKIAPAPRVPPTSINNVLTVLRLMLA
jgi:hypothetical protein